MALVHRSWHASETVACRVEQQSVQRENAEGSQADRTELLSSQLQLNMSQELVLMSAIYCQLAGRAES